MFEYQEEWQILKKIRDAVLKMIEIEREKGIVKHSLEAQITMSFDDIDKLSVISEGKELFFQEAFFKEFFIVSKVTIKQSHAGLHKTLYEGLNVLVEHAEGIKCPRCWHWSKDVDHRDLDKRCQEIV